MAIVFSETYKHQGLEFLPGVAVGFEDPDAEPFFIKIGLAQSTSDTPVREYSQDEISVDPDTVFADGQLVAEAPDDGPGALERMGTASPIQPADVNVTAGAGNSPV